MSTSIDARPILEAQRTDDGSQLAVWCDHCYCNHFHGRHNPDFPSCQFDAHNGLKCTCPTGCADGHRAAHCSSNSPYRNRGYVLRESPPKPTKPPKQAKPTSKTHVLYRFYGRENELLYVGITCNPPSRFTQHRDSKNWWENVCNIKIENFTSRDELVKAERTAIQSEKPKFNVIHNVRNPIEMIESTPTQRHSHPLVGKFFHTTKQCSHGATIAVWQGHVTGFADGYLIIELFEWLMGEPAEERLITTTDLAEASTLFYPDGDAMRFSYQYGAVRHMSQCDDLQ